MKKLILKLGDIHGKWMDIKNIIQRMDLENCIIIQVGDFGIGFGMGFGLREQKKEEKTLDIFNGFLKKKNIQMYVIRGNHDNPFYFTGNYNLSNISFLKDYTVLNLEGDNYLFAGGAISIDRSPNPIFNHKGRKEGKDYWKDEGFLLNETLLKDLTNIDYVITHDAPEFAEPFYYTNDIFNWFKYDSNLQNEVETERKNLTRMFDILKEKNKIKKWYYGHFHNSKISMMGDTEFILLGINEFKE